MVRSQARYMVSSDRRTAADTMQTDLKASAEENSDARLLGPDEDEIVKAETGTASTGYV